MIWCEARDIVAVSIPFTAGVVVAALLPLEGEAYLWPALFSSALASLSLLLSCRTGNCHFSVTALYLFLGMMACCSAAISGKPPQFPPETASDALCGFSSLIDNAGFSDKRTGALLKALLIGDRSSIGRETVEIFRKSGASHILALSGLHLGIIYGIIAKALSIFGKSRPSMIVRSVIILVVSAYYVIMTGASPSIIRAFLFICINEIFSFAPGRKRSPLAAFCSALLIQLSVNPAVILSIGFQLSYLAMFGILTVYPRLRALYPSGRRSGVMPLLWNSMSLSVSCQLFTAPLVWFHFRTFPSFFLITNLISLPLVELLMVCAVFCLCCEALSCCPELMKNLCDALAQALLYCLEVISSL